jgi:zinc transporter ZupT
LKLVPNGTPRWRAALWSIMTSLPQPLLAVPAYLFVSYFKPLVPWGLGFAAGCMIWMCFADLFSESYEGTDPKIVGVIVSLSVIFLLRLQMMIS